MTYTPLKPRIVALEARPPKKPSTRRMGFSATDEPGVQAKFDSSTWNDPLEREADAIAAQAMRAAEPSGANPAARTAQRQFPACTAMDDEEKAQPKPDGDEALAQTRLVVEPADSPLEEEADAIAVRVTQHISRTEVGALGLPSSISPTHERSLQRTCAACSQHDEDDETTPLQRRASDLHSSRRAVELPSLAQVRAEGGQPIPPRVRASLESALRHDFSLVRVHTGPLAGRSARALGAEAFTSRNDIVFARDRYHPHTSEGLGLLAHELVHTIQQRSSRPLSTAALPIMRAPVQVQARMAPPLAQEQEQEAIAVCSPWSAVLCEPVTSRTNEYARQRDALRGLAGEIDRVEAELRESEGWSGDGTAPTLARSAIGSLRVKAQAVVDAGPEKPTPYQPLDKGGVFGEERLKTLIREMVVRLRTIELRREEDDPATAASTVLLEWQHSMATFQLGRPPKSEPTLDDIRANTAESVMQRLVAPSKDLGDNLQATEDLITAIELRRKALREGSRQGQPVQSYFVKLQPFVQAAIDDLARRAATGSGIREELRRLYVLMKRLEGILFREIPDPSSSRRTVLLGSLEVDATKGVYDSTRTTGPQGRHDDFFGAKTSVKVFPYSTDDGFDKEELKLSVLAITRSRIKQIEFLSGIYGSRLHQSDETEATDESRAKLAKVGGRGLNLHSDSDWRHYLLARFKANIDRGTSRADAYRDLVSTVRIYFDSFAVHSPYNIDDFGDTYIDRNFPRALSGQLIHDCGVYALRMAYMLSLVRVSLGLTFHFVRLPFHFALVIRGGGSLPTLVVNNDDLEWVEDGVAQDLVKKHNLSEAQLAGELASHHFAPGTRLPFFTSELNKEHLDKKSMWREYKKLSEKNPFSDAVADPSSPLHGRDLEYLKYMSAAIDAFNALVYPLWTSTLPAMWRKTQGELRDCRKDGGSEISKKAGGPMACEEAALRVYRRRSRSRTIQAINTYLAAATKALEAVPNAIAPQLVFTVVPTARPSPNITVSQAPATARGLEPGLAAQGANESNPEIMFDSGLKPATAPASRIELLRFLILSVQDAELDMSNALVYGDSFEIVYADSPAIPEKGVQFGAGAPPSRPADYVPPFARREYQIDRLRW